MSSRKLDMSIPNTSFPTLQKGLVLDSDGKIPSRLLPAGGLTSIGDSTPTSLTGLLKGNGTDIDVAVGGVDYLRPVDINMGLKVDKDSVVAAATRIVASKLLAGDTQPAFQANGDGTLKWGPGGSTVVDTQLYRSGANTLATPGAIVVGKAIAVDNAGAGDRLFFGSAVDTSLYRNAAAALITPGSFSTGAATTTLGSNSAGAGTYAGPGGTFASVRSAYGFSFTASVLADPGTYRFMVDSNGVINWADGTLASADTNLYRSSAGWLKTDQGNLSLGDANIHRSQAGGLRVENDLIVYRYLYVASLDTSDTTTNMGLGGLGPGGQIGARFGGDTNLYRLAAGVLKTDGQLRTGGYLYLDGDQGIFLSNSGGAGYAFLWAKRAADTQPRLLLRDGGPGGESTGMIQFGPGGATAPDTNLYRSAAGVLKTDGALIVAGAAANVVVSDATLAAIGTATRHNNFEWGNQNAGGFRGALGSDVNNGQLFLVFYGSHGTNNSTYRSFGFRSSLIEPDTVGGFKFRNVASASADNQAAVTTLAIDNTGTLLFGSAADTSLYRAGANVLKTGGTFDAAHISVAGSLVLPEENLPVRLAGGTYYVADLNNVYENGWFPWSNTTANTPVAGAYGYCICQNLGSTNVRQFAYRYNTDDAWMRRKNDSGAWGGWIQTWPVTTVATSFGPTGFSYANEWTNKSGGFNWGAASRTGLIVTLDGVAYKPSSTTSGGELVCTIPAGFRPQSAIMGIGKANGGYWEAFIHGDGTVNINGWSGNPASGDGSGWISFTGISYPYYS